MFWRIIGGLAGFTWVISAFQIWGDSNCDSITFGGGGRRAIGFVCQSGGSGAGGVAFLFLILGAALILYAFWPFIAVARRSSKSQDDFRGQPVTEIETLAYTDTDVARDREILEAMAAIVTATSRNSDGEVLCPAVVGESSSGPSLAIRFLPKLQWVITVESSTGFLSLTTCKEPAERLGKDIAYSETEVVLLDGAPFEWRWRDSQGAPSAATKWIIIKMGLTYDKLLDTPGALVPAICEGDDVIRRRDCFATAMRTHMAGMGLSQEKAYWALDVKLP